MCPRRWAYVQSRVSGLLLALLRDPEGANLKANPDLGAFVGVPNRHQLDFHVAADARAIPSLNMLAAFTAAGYRDAAGVVSPNVYWWRPSSLRRISTLTPDGPRIEVDIELQSVLETLTRH